MTKVLKNLTRYFQDEERGTFGNLEGAGLHFAIAGDKVLLEINNVLLEKINNSVGFFVVLISSGQFL